MTKNKKNGHYPKNWDKISRNCKELAGWKCQDCGRQFEPEVPDQEYGTHHLDGDKSNSDFTNLRALCASCHLAHERRSYWAKKRFELLQRGRRHGQQDLPFLPQNL